MLLVYGGGLLAGLLTSLSPCVLPLLPIVVGSALGAGTLGPLALAGGLALSFAGLGLGLAALGSTLDPEVLRDIGVAMLAAAGLLLVSARAQAGFTRLATPLGLAAERGAARIGGGSLAGQLGIGLLLGAVWSPCVGPTLGAAISLAGQGRSLAEAGGVMALFGIGAALPLLALGHLSRPLLQRWRGRLAATGQGGRRALGAALLVTALFIASGADRRLESWLTRQMPDWLISLTTSV